MNDVTPNNPDDTPSTPSPETQNQTSETDNRVPQSRFNQVIAEKNELKARLDALEQAEAERQRKKLEETGQYQEIIQSLEPKAKRVDELTETLQDYLQKELDAIPSDMRDLVPDGDVTAQLKWIQNARTKGLFDKPKAPVTDAGEKGVRKAPDEELTPEQQRYMDMARSSGHLRRRG